MSPASETPIAHAICPWKTAAGNAGATVPTGPSPYLAADHRPIPRRGLCGISIGAVVDDLRGSERVSPCKLGNYKVHPDSGLRSHLVLCNQ